MIMRIKDLQTPRIAFWTRPAQREVYHAPGQADFVDLIAIYFFTP